MKLEPATADLRRKTAARRARRKEVIGVVGDGPGESGLIEAGFGQGALHSIPGKLDASGERGLFLAAHRPDRVNLGTELLLDRGDPLGTDRIHLVSPGLGVGQVQVEIRLIPFGCEGPGSFLETLRIRREAIQQGVQVFVGGGFHDLLPLHLLGTGLSAGPWAGLPALVGRSEYGQWGPPEPDPNRHRTVDGLSRVESGQVLRTRKPLPDSLFVTTTSPASVLLVRTP